MLKRFDSRSMDWLQKRHRAQSHLVLRRLENDKYYLGSSEHRKDVQLLNTYLLEIKAREKQLPLGL